MVHIQATYEGALRCRATHGPSHTTFVTDAPVDNHGKGESFSPTDLVATALGTCMLTTMALFAERHGWSLEGSWVDVEKVMVSDPVRRIGALEVVISIPVEHEAKVRTALERAAMTCPVHQSLRPEVKIPVRFAWGTAAARG